MNFLMLSIECPSFKKSSLIWTDFNNPKAVKRSDPIANFAPIPNGAPSESPLRKLYKSIEINIIQTIING